MIADELFRQMGIPVPVYSEATIVTPDGMEWAERYVPGGFHPTHIGDMYHDGRYEIVHKLGWGSFATVWLARDNKEGRYVALKIHAADAFENSQDGRAYVSTLLDEFVINGPNGQHLCIVSKAAGCSVWDQKNETLARYSPKTARAISAQLLLGLDYIHACGVVHADLHEKNIVFQFPIFQQVTSNSELYETVDKPRIEPLRRMDRCPISDEEARHLPRYFVYPPYKIFAEADKIVDPKILIVDFGASFSQGQGKLEDLKCCRTHLPIEAFFEKDEPISPAVDVWEAGCTIYDILGKQRLFLKLVDSMVDILGVLPKRWWDRWEWRSDSFNEDGSPKGDMHSESLPMQIQYLRSEYAPATLEYSPEEFASLEKLLRAMLAYETSERITISEALQSEWMVRWALPAIKEAL
ncbi:kinase-like protein [Xylona heveae TC161]|uniref:non-specific serine/threonine protein kinase n=1 Tax=Xylona heveae (strain CBS 132557 / TC161) TaxID=1328760 RepID=A0A165G0N0_XYLHT|nr:kinase-like protein [Xylona heveae TC161]KZF21600.1 kinase-like protein [Xylona heveae TC161]